MKIDFEISKVDCEYSVAVVGLGENCTMDSMCAPNDSYCDSVSGQCECVSTHYDSTGDELAGTCLESKFDYGEWEYSQW